MAILDKKAEIAGISLPEDVRAFIATHSNSGNVRELEGALTQLLARSSLVLLGHKILPCLKLTARACYL